MHRVLRLDVLESRDMLAGNVTAELAGDNLRITGDDFGNSIEIEQIGSAIYVTGNERTAINGTRKPFVTSVGRVERMFIRMKDGNNIVEITNLRLRDDLDVETGDGNDRVSVMDSRIGGELEIETRQGHDSVRVEDGPGSTRGMSVGDEVEIHTHDGNDFVSLDSHVGGHVLIHTGDDNDRVHLQAFYNDATYERNVRVDTGSGNDTVRILEAYGDFRMHVGGDLIVRTGRGNDISNIGGSALGVGGIFHVEGDMDVNLGSGNDRFFAGNNGFGSTFIGGRLDIRAGAGNDQVSVLAGLGSMQIEDRIRIDGGSGRDVPVAGISKSVLEDAALWGRKTKVVNFEAGGGRPGSAS